MLSPITQPRSLTHTELLFFCVYPTDEWEEMSVVAVNNKVARALDTKDFQLLLKALGLKQPSEQVTMIGNL